PNATGDDTNPTGGNDDENGVIIPALNPGNPVTITVGVRTGNNSPGYLQGWIDFNGDGDFADSGERIFTDLQLGTGIYTRTINVPATATLGQTFARFRYGYEQGAAAKSTGHALAGEVEDYVVNVLNDVPDARDDVFPRTGVDPLIKVGQVDVPLDVLANDIGSNFGGTQNPPQLVGIISPTTGLPVSSVILTTGSIVRLNPVDVPTVGTAAGTLLLYTPGPNVGGGSDSFQYQITDGTGRPIAFDTAMVTVNVNPPDPRAVDDLAFVTNVVSPAIPTATIIDVLANDRPIVGSTRISNIVQVSSLPNPAVVPTIVAGTSTTNDTLSFTPPVGFQGTIIYRYTINTPGIGTSDALLTIQVTPGTTTRGSEHDAQFTVEYVDINGNLTNTVNQGDDFFVRVYVQDFGVHTNIQNTQGAETAYLDLLVQNIGASPNLKLAEPVIVPNGSGGLRYDINFTTPPQGTYNQLTLDDPTISSPGLLNEVGATEFFDANGNHPALGTSPIAVMLVRFHALAAGQIRVQPDHAEGFGTEVVLQTVSGFPNFSIAIPDEFVFLPQAPALNIVVPLAAGEGFTNPENHYDVNFDTRVNAQDILTVINDLSTNGIRQLSQIAIGMSGKVPGAYVDTNVDSLVNVLDILAIINFMTATAGAYGEGEALVAATPSLAAEPTGDVGGAGDSRTSSTDAAVAMFTVGDDDVAVADPVVVNPEIFYSTTADEPHVLVVDPPPAFPTRGFGRGHGAEVATLDAEAADELFAKMDRFRDQLRQRIASRRR
ncbi:MAG: GEVED domain-containing protein, partial [Pirellulaceae bacterium]|nr:GEVED domain-containing protein [Pirellulaceae bacterium]